MNKQNPDRSQELQTLMSGADEEQRLASEKEFQEISQVGGRTCDVKWLKPAVCVSYISIAVTSGFGITFVVLSEIANSPAAFAFALAAILDTLSSAVVVWRFSGSRGAHFSFERERRACIVISSCFILSSIAIAGKAIYSLLMEKIPGKEFVMEILTSASFFVLLLLTCAKWYIADKVESRAMKIDALNSLANAAMTLGIILSDLVCERKPNICFLDSVTAIIIAAALFSYGLKALVELLPQKGTEHIPTD